MIAQNFLKIQKTEFGVQVIFILRSALKHLRIKTIKVLSNLFPYLWLGFQTAILSNLLAYVSRKPAQTQTSFKALLVICDQLNCLMKPLSFTSNCYTLIKRILLSNTRKLISPPQIIKSGDVCFT